MGIQSKSCSNVRQLIPNVKAPRQAFLERLGQEDLKVFRRFTTEPVEYVEQSKFRLARTQRDLFGPQASGRLDSGKGVDAALPAPSAETERFLFDRYNYARYRVYRVLDQYADRALPVQAAREVLLWGKRALRIRAEIIQLNMPLVLSMAKRSRLEGLDFNEMISEGNMALIRSVEKFDATRGFKFSTYSCRAIIKSFSRVALRASRYRGMFPMELTTELERSDFLERKRQTIEEYYVEELRNILFNNRAELSDVEQTVIRERFALGAGSANPSSKTLEQVGAIIGVTKERVRQIQNKALQKIKVVLEAQDIAA